MPKPREMAVRRIAERAAVFPQLDPPSGHSAVAAVAADPRDLALAGAIEHAVARRWLTLTAVLESRLQRPWAQVEPSLQAVLLAGAAQLLLLERIPDHAAVDESVEIARRVVRSGAAGFTNAVLRKVADLRREIVTTPDPDRRDELPLADGRVWRLAEPVFAEDPVRRLAQATSHPQTLIRRWMGTLGEKDAVDGVARHDLVVPPIVVTEAPAPDDPRLSPHEEPGFFVFEGASHELKSYLDTQPTARVQDPASAHPVATTAALRPRLIIDACAGMGTKTKQLAALHPEARIIAADIDEGRHRILRQTFAASEQVEVRRYEDLPAHAGEADLLVLDVPCSNTGVLARRVEARYRLNARILRSLVDLQRHIISTTLPLLGSEGHVLYATCSIEPEENEEQVAWIEATCGLEASGATALLPQGKPGDPPSRYRDGGFSALLAGR